MEPLQDDNNAISNLLQSATNEDQIVNDQQNLPPIVIQIEYDSGNEDSLERHNSEVDSKEVSALEDEASDNIPQVGILSTESQLNEDSSSHKNSQDNVNNVLFLNSVPSKEPENSSPNTELPKTFPEITVLNAEDTSNISTVGSLLKESHSEEAKTIEVQLPSTSKEFAKHNELYGKDTGPHWYNVKGNIITPPVIVANLPKMFDSLPIHGAPHCKDDLEAFQMKKIRDFVGCDLADDEFEELANYCRPEHLKTGDEMRMTTSVPVTNKMMVEADLRHGVVSTTTPRSSLKRYNMISDMHRHSEFNKKLKYRGVRLIPLSSQYSDPANTRVNSDPSQPLLEPGKDILYRVRIYRPFTYSLAKDRVVKMRHTVFSCDLVLLGRQTLAELRDRLVCQNDVDMRVDVSASPDLVPLTTAKEIFPSGFLFINDVFYVDRREGCADLAAPLRQWAARRGLGTFPARDMDTRLDRLVLKLGYPEVYVHQGNCEHLFTFSEIRLLAPTDPLSLDSYPCHMAVSQDQAVYCTTCAEFSAKWVVVGCSRVPFDPAFFCDTCFNLYLYKDGEKIGDFRAFTYKGNEISMLKPQTSYLGDGMMQAEGCSYDQIASDMYDEVL